MKTIIKIIFNFFRLFIQSVYSFLTILRFFVKPIKLAQQNINSEVFILGNGSSLQDGLSKFSNELIKKDLLVVNEFCLSKYFEILKPKYYVLVDQAYLKDFNISEKFLITQQKILEIFCNNVSWEITIFIPFIAENKMKWLNLQNLNKKIEIQFVNINTISGFDRIKYFLYSKNMGMPRVQNVIIASIFLAINMNYKNIFLLGTDHSMHQDIVVNKNSNLCIAIKHFNSSDSLKPFYSDYLEQNILKIDQFFLMWSLTFQGYYQLKKYSEINNIQIYNTSLNSFIDAFPKIDLEKVLKI
jgi:hypothetical protein